MAPRTTAVGLICRSCQSPLVRQFSSGVPTRSRAFPEFAPTSQPELDALLSQYREELFVPENLSKAHRRLMYRPTKHSLLTSDAGVTVSVSDEEEVRLEPKFITNRPKKRKTLARIIKTLSENDSPEAWSNLKPFLEGMKTAHWELPKSFMEQITRKAKKLGKERVLIECAEQAAKTGARLTDPFFTRELLHGCHERAVHASFQGEVYEKAARQAQNITMLLDRDEHCGKLRTGRLPDGHYDMRKSLFVNSVHLEMVASRLLTSSSNPTDSTGDVGRAVARVLALASPPEPGLSSFAYAEFKAKEVPGESENSRSRSFKLGVVNMSLENLLVTWSGMKFASKIPSAVAGPDRDAFATRMTEITEQIKQAEGEVRELSGEKSDSRRPIVLLKQLRIIHG